MMKPRIPSFIWNKFLIYPHELHQPKHKLKNTMFLKMITNNLFFQTLAQLLLKLTFLLEQIKTQKVSSKKSASTEIFKNNTPIIHFSLQSPILHQAKHQLPILKEKKEDTTLF